MLLSQIVKEFKISKKFIFAIISGIITQMFFAIFKIYTLNAFVTSNETISPMNGVQTTVYIWITQLMFMLVPWNVNWKDFDSVRTGSIALDLIKPVGIFEIIFSKTFAWRFVNFLNRSIPMFLIVAYIFKIFNFKSVYIPVPKLETFVLFIISLILSIILSTLITVFLYSLSFIFVSISNVIGIIGSLAFVLSGMVIPLSFYPKVLLTFLNFQPFKFIVDTPALIFNEVYDIKNSMLQILLQILWIFIFYIMSYKIYKKVTDKLEINGG